jgi:pimeloyl-ACP methyl ester carboxylesterase
MESGLLNRRQSEASPGPLAELVSRFDPHCIDVPDPGAVVRLEVTDGNSWDVTLSRTDVELSRAGDAEPASRLSADSRTWQRIADDVRGGMRAFHEGRLRARGNLHLGVGFLAATSGSTDPGRLRFGRIASDHHDLAYATAGQGPAVVCIHGLGGTKASFLSTVSALAPEGYRVIAIDLPGFGDSHKPLAAAYNAPYFAGAILELLDTLGIGSAHMVGNSMGGRIAIELGLLAPDRTDRMVLLSPALAWLRPRQWNWLLRFDLPKLGLLQPTPRWVVEPIVRGLIPGADHGWAAAGVDEFLRAFLTPRGRVAFYESARNIYMDEPHGEDGFWTRLAELSPDTLFVWGRQDMLVPISFMRHVEDCLPAARHLELDCGHVPQMEAPRRTHAAMLDFFRDSGGPAGS